jgi:hypothetical protein
MRQEQSMVTPDYEFQVENVACSVDYDLEEAELSVRTEDGLTIKLEFAVADLINLHQEIKRELKRVLAEDE